MTFRPEIPLHRRLQLRVCEPLIEHIEADALHLRLKHDTRTRAKQEVRARAGVSEEYGRRKRDDPVDHLEKISLALARIVL